MFLLTTLPNGPFMAQCFKVGSRAQLVKVVAAMTHSFPIGSRVYEVGPEWEDFAREAPSSDLVNEYTARKSLHCPLAGVLLGFEAGPAMMSPAMSPLFALGPLTVRTGESVRCARNLEPEPPRIWIETINEIFTPVFDMTILLAMGVNELKARISTINQECGFKLPKQGNKTQLCDSLLAAYKMKQVVNGANQRVDGVDAVSSEGVDPSMPGISQRAARGARAELVEIVKKFNDDNSGSVDFQPVSISGSYSKIMSRAQKANIVVSK